MTAAEAVAAYDCLEPTTTAAYGKSDNSRALEFRTYRIYSKQPYISGTHGNRFVMNYGNAAAKNYGAYENAGVFAAGSVLAKPSFSVKGNGKATLGPLFLMEKMEAGFSSASDDWRYTMVMPDGSMFGTTKGKGSAKVEFCVGCHMSVAPEADSMMFLPADYRAAR